MPEPTDYEGAATVRHTKLGASVKIAVFNSLYPPYSYIFDLFLQSLFREIMPALRGEAKEEKKRFCNHAEKLITNYSHQIIHLSATRPTKLDKDLNVAIWAATKR